MIADTALSMAKSLLIGAIGKAASAAANKMSLVMGVRKDIWYVHMHVFCYSHDELPTASLLHSYHETDIQYPFFC